MVGRERAIRSRAGTGGRRKGRQARPEAASRDFPSPPYALPSPPASSSSSLDTGRLRVEAMVRRPSIPHRRRRRFYIDRFHQNRRCARRGKKRGRHILTTRVRVLPRRNISRPTTEDDDDGSSPRMRLGTHAENAPRANMRIR